MNAWQESRLKEFCEFYKWPIEDTRKMFENSREFFELVWRGMDPQDRAAEEVYYNGPWLTLRQMSYHEGDAIPDYYKKFIDGLKPGESLLDFGCGVGDTLIYAQDSGKRTLFGVEMPGKIEFLKFRSKHRDHYWTVLPYVPESRVFDRAILSSILDHVPDPVNTAHNICEIVKGPILATPEIDESYDRPTHQKYILKNVPAAFKVIEEHNANL